MYAVQFIKKRTLSIWFTTKLIYKFHRGDLRRLYQSQNLFLFIFLVLPWLSGNASLGVIADLMSVIAYFNYIRDSIHLKSLKADELGKIHQSIEEHYKSILRYLKKENIPTKRIKNRPATLEIYAQNYTSFEYYKSEEINHIEYIVILSLKNRPTEKERKCITYAYINDIRTDLRTDYCKKRIDMRQWQKGDSHENYLVKYIFYLRKNGKHPTKNTKLPEIVPDAPITLAFINQEFGNGLNTAKLETMITDSSRYERVKEIVSLGIERGLISDDSIKNLTKDKNKFFVIIKYGEGTNKPGWPTGMNAPLGELLNREKFVNPFFHERYTFFRDIDKHPLPTEASQYVDDLIGRLEKQYRSLRRRPELHDVEVIQTGPHFELVGFFVDKSSFLWEISKTHGMNSFMRSLLVADAIEGAHADSFIKANYIKLRFMFNEIHPFSLFDNENFRNLCLKGVGKIATPDLRRKIGSLHGFVTINEDENSTIISAIHTLLKASAFSYPTGSAKAIKLQKRFIQTKITTCKNICSEYLKIMEELQQ